MSTTNAPAAAASVPVVLLHSSMSSKAQWSRLVKRLDARFAPIGIDLYGYGDTPMPAGGPGFSLADEVALVNAAIARQIGPHQPFHLIGHSYGGAVSLRLASEQPARILSLALYEPVAFYLLERTEGPYREVADVVAHINAEIGSDQRLATRMFIDYWSGEGAFDGMPSYVQTALSSQIEKVQLDFQALMGDSLRLADLATLEVPACVIKGSDSPQSSRRIAALLAQTLPRVRCHEIKGGHMAPITHSDDVNALLLAFLDEVAPR